MNRTESPVELVEINRLTRIETILQKILDQLPKTPENTRATFLNTREAAVFLKTTPAGIYSLIKRGKIRPMPGRPGRLLFSSQALEQYLRDRYRRR